MSKQKTRCTWAGSDPLYQSYHDAEWGVPCFDDQRLFEFLILEGAQAGLAWITILRKRANYLKNFDDFDPRKVARYSQKRIEKLLQDPGIVRNRLKVESTVTNAEAFLLIQEKHGSFSDYLWDYVDGEPITNHWRTINQVPASTPLSDQLSKDLKKAGFRFVGTTICYAYMQAVGMVNDHTTDCFRHSEVKQLHHG
ncbi:MAG: DNA-3-methyladenine glycosylase I [Candidatus Thiodiazotropha sp. (ex Semelilucina semeliformis)]|nr:DNA-3-methyladenine glycosylase I [Candidatus Thiodiazotropha sp. (ex Myrtea spinifera)]MCU7807441.1 DNA-3-methyladenine glycosylase I [Candidatus Thiodiazotropha sp. (ex Semelilucina semeliformis)]